MLNSKLKYLAASTSVQAIDQQVIKLCSPSHWFPPPIDLTDSGTDSGMNSRTDSHRQDYSTQLTTVPLPTRGLTSFVFVLSAVNSFVV